MKKYLFLVFLVTLVVMLVGCATDDSAPAAGTGGAGGTAAPAVDLPADAPDSWLVGERTTITLAASLAPNWAHPDEGSFWQWLEEYTNVAVNWITFLNAEAGEQFALMMAGGSLPDGFIGGLGGGNSNVLQYGMDLGVYIPLNDLLASYAPHFTRRAPLAMPDVMNVITAPDGNIYALPLIHPPGEGVFNTTAINQTFLDALGLDAPTTIEEVEQVLIAFRDGDPNGNGIADEIPLSFLFQDWGAADHSWWFAPFGAPLSNDLVLIENGVVTFQAAQEYFRDGARWLASLYAQGLVDLEVFTYDQTTYRARAGADPVVFGIWSSWSPWADAGAQGHHFTTLLPPIQGPGGAHVLWEENASISRDSFIITSAASNPELMVRWVDTFYRDVETGLRASRGPGPDPNMAWYFDDEGRIVWTDPLPDEFIRGMNELPFAPGAIGLEYNPAPLANPDLKVEHIENVLRPYAANFFNGTWSRWPLTFMQPHEADEISFIEAGMVPFANRMLARWIANEGDVDAEWEQFLVDLDAYGLQRWLSIRQEVYDRFLSN
ncbi:MAG: extracellular solute-binding protein [Defluviitaleaceae bacterium]|nr:extracellular solute-binding protein [Defluviitaleaceae bacterium]